jgi:hypothetical protein
LVSHQRKFLSFFFFAKINRWKVKTWSFLDFCQTRLKKGKKDMWKKTWCFSHFYEYFTHCRQLKCGYKHRERDERWEIFCTPNLTRWPLIVYLEIWEYNFCFVRHERLIELLLMSQLRVCIDIFTFRSID